VLGINILLLCSGLSVLVLMCARARVCVCVCIYIYGGRGGAMVKALCYKLEGRWFDSRWCHWNFSLT